jgi:hypothetical protein
MLMALSSAWANDNSPRGWWLPTGLISPTGSPLSQTSFWTPYQASFDGIRLAWQLFDGIHSRRLALDYDPAGRNVSHIYNDYFAAYSSAPNMYRYDNLLFSRRFMAAAPTRRELSPRGIAAPPDLGIDDVQWAEGWKTGYLLGSRAVYTAGSLYNYQTANLRFPRAGVTVIVMANTASTDALSTAEHAAAFVLPGRQARAAAVAPPTIASLLGTYRRRATADDGKTMVLPYLSGIKDGFPRLRLRPNISPTLWQLDMSLGLHIAPPHAAGITRDYLTLTIGRDGLRLGSAQSYAATDGSSLQIFGLRPGLLTNQLCFDNGTLSPTGVYHWSMLGNQLFIVKVSDPFCAARSQLLPGTWTRVAKSS